MLTPLLIDGGGIVESILLSPRRLFSSLKATRASKTENIFKFAESGGEPGDTAYIVSFEPTSTHGVFEALIGMPDGPGMRASGRFSGNTFKVERWISRLDD